MYEHLEYATPFWNLVLKKHINWKKFSDMLQNCSFTSQIPMSNRRRHIGTQRNPEPSKCLGVFGLSVYTTKRQLHLIFDKFASLEKVKVVLDSKTGKSRGFAFVYFESMKDAADAKDECSGMEIAGRRIRVVFSINKRPRTPTPGIYMGRPTS
ncbi:transformer 2 beta, partial [Halocaridina rubra]